MIATVPVQIVKLITSVSFVHSQLTPEGAKYNSCVCMIANIRKLISAATVESREKMGLTSKPTYVSRLTQQNHLDWD